MITRRNGIAVLGAGALTFYAAQWGFSRPEFEFSRAAPSAPPTVDLRAGISTAVLALPIDLTRVGRRAEDALSQRLVQLAEATPKSDAGIISRAGAIEVQAQGSIVRLRLPLKIETQTANARAAGAESITNKSVSELSISFPFTAAYNPSAGFEIAQWEDASTEASQSTAAAAQRLAKQLEARLKPVAIAAQDELRQVLSTLPVKTATARAWAALSQPVELGQGSGLWLKGGPEHVGSGAFVMENGKTVYNIGIATRLAIGDGERGGAGPVKRQVAYGQVVHSEGSRIRMALPVGLDQLQKATDAAFVGGTFETKADRFSSPVKVAVQKTRLYPAARLIGVEFGITATALDGQTFQGKVHLAGRPMLNSANATVTLADVTFPAIASKDATSTKSSTSAPRIGAEPFAGKFATVAVLDVSGALADAAPRAANVLHQRIDDRLSLSARMSDVVPVSVETSRDGVWLLVDIAGLLTLNYDGPEERVVASGGPVDRQSELKPASTAATLAAVGGAAGAAAMVAASRAQADRVKALPNETKREPIAVKPKTILRRQAAKPGSAVAAKGPWVPFGNN